MGEQLFENYGQPNHIYFMYHGFVLPDNSHDCAHLELSMSPSDRARVDASKAEFLLNVSRRGRFVVLCSPVCRG